jgi:nitroreductase
MKDFLSAVESSQHCQRNWDLSREIDPEHIKIFEEVVKNVPSKQNIAYYKVHFITNRNIIEEIYKWTMTETPIISAETGEETDFYNPQVLANLLVAFEAHWDIIRDDRGQVIEERNIKNINYNGYTINVDRHQSIGIASGVLALTANYLGYKTGFCRCFKQDRINNILKTKNNIDMLLGIGYPKNVESHTVHHISDTLHVHPLPKTEIPVLYLD